MASPEHSFRGPISTGLMREGYEYLVQPTSELLPDSWKIAHGESLNIQDRANLVVCQLAAEMGDALYDVTDFGWGKKISGSVQGRPEDDEITIDVYSQEVAKKSLRKSGRRFRLPFHVIGEHGSFRVGKNLPKEAIGVMDPIDNSDEYNRGIEGQDGLDTPQHFAFGMYDLKNRPLAAVDINLARRHVFINRDGKNYFYNARTGDILYELPEPPKVTTIKQREFVLADYEGRPGYERLFNAFLGDVKLHERHPKSTKHAKGGSHIYPYQALGAVSAYVMFKEPRGEIDQTLHFALAAGYKAYEVDIDTGERKPYVFNPFLHARKKNVGLFMSVSSDALAEEICGHYKKAKDGMSEEEFASYRAEIVAA